MICVMKMVWGRFHLIPVGSIIETISLAVLLPMNRIPSPGILVDVNERSIHKIDAKTISARILYVDALY